MRPVPDTVATFLRGKRFAVAGVSRSGRQPSNAILKRFRECGYEVYPVNPAAPAIGGEPCYPDLRSIPVPLDGVMIATAPSAASDVVRQCAELGITRVWFHRSFGDGSVSPDALAACRANHIDPIVGGCPLMYCGGVDIFHKCMRWWLRSSGKIPG
jgi:predicted CoA-binding protein